MARNDNVAERTCIVTRKVLDPDDLIRFVAAPDGAVVADLKRCLPGRGVWVTGKRDVVEQAVAKSLFSRGLKTSAKATADLPDRIDGLLQEAALGALGFARKAGQCVTGANQAESAVRSGKAIGLLHATDAAEDGIRKLRQAIVATRHMGGNAVHVSREFSSVQLSVALGGTHVIHAALTDGGAAKNCLHHIARLANYRGNGNRDEAGHPE